jgi:hypothetical protein
MSIQEPLFDLPAPKRRMKGLLPGEPWLDQYPSFDEAGRLRPLTDQERAEGLECLRWWCTHAAERGWKPPADLQRFVRPGRES